MADAPTCDFGTLLVADRLDKVYGEGDAATHALKEMSFTFCDCLLYTSPSPRD